MNKKNNKKAQKPSINTKLITTVLIAVVSVSMVCAVVFGLKIHKYGVDVTVTYSLGKDGGTGSIRADSQVVEYGKKYQLYIPTNSDRDMRFDGWRIAGTTKTVASSGVWKYDEDLKLVAVWVNESEYTNNY